MDVVFYGDSITEGWMGTSFGKPGRVSVGSKEVFENLFSTDYGAHYDGLALGIAGDTVSVNHRNIFSVGSWCFLTFDCIVVSGT